MRLGVLDIGSNTGHLLLIEGQLGSRPEAYTAAHKEPLQLVRYIDADGNITDEGRDRLTAFVKSAVLYAIEHGAEDLLAFATSAIRESKNGPEVLQHVQNQTGVNLTEITGDQEAAITYHAVRHWQGWGAGRILNFDIGGGSFEFSTGMDAYPDDAISVPLGATRLTGDWFSAPVPSPKEIKKLRKYVRETLESVAETLLAYGQPNMVVGTSKTFRSLARICGAAPYSAGPFVKREMLLQDLRLWTRRMEAMPPSEREDLPGVSDVRAEQMLAGAIAAETAMDVFGVDRMRVSPWALREGLVLRRLNYLSQQGPEAMIAPRSLAEFVQD
ncbi:Ppx/GppA family phosphatase [Rothia nasimurium]|uniref:Ppx/GppA family phosphatase n=1 Tax=Rothia nasimurium TaxID=85336 RepID=A0A4Y9F4E6_9MICC|nr:Ppx/GppA phosphatase family protein [Rothia nasimurium]MBF0808297.1 Ppx/GppA family phosphatase [Rothia nasimurium]TFU22249.1 Ppx/GppA family phosphatase [Rothia nasimurium]